MYVGVMLVCLKRKKRMDGLYGCNKCECANIGPGRTTQTAEGRESSEVQRSRAVPVPRLE